MPEESEGIWKGGETRQAYLDKIRNSSNALVLAMIQQGGFLDHAM